MSSIKNNKKGILLMLLSSFCVCIGQLFWKISNEKIIFLFVGFAIYGIGALLMLTAYKYGSLSVLQPMLSCNYIFTIILAYFFLHESIGFLKGVGVLTVFIGVVLIGGSDD